MFFTSKTPNYRFSLVTVDLELEGKKVKREYSNPKRYSFFLGRDAKIHTPQQYLKERVTDFNDLQKRFSIEVVNKDFYTQIAILFTKLTGGKREIGSKSFEVKKGILVFPSPDDTKRKEFTVRLIGRLVFCWFLKKKHLLPEELLSTVAIDNNQGYYHKTLEPLFFKVLNTPMDGREKVFTAKPWSIIPFLNGGLFTQHIDDYYPDNEQQKSQFVNMLLVPDYWLKELLAIFETYNFTIDENTPVDVELSIEPEMLGRIFENLLAEINPETDETARKETGSYYTPRPIVEYMVDESLKQYLITKTNLPEDKISPLLSYSEEDTDLTETQKDSVLDALDTIKIIDPACGSGAFPMGILQKILLILQKIDPDSKKWLRKILERVNNPLARTEFEKELKTETINYIHKIGVIQNSIFGVDIQPIAVEISKLRCFLSLIVDENVNDKEKNRGVKPLPNLEFKFVCANTLIGLGGDMLLTNEITRKINELKLVREEYLNSYGKDKKDLENRFLSIRSELSQLALNWQKGKEKVLQLVQWNPFSHESCHWFDPDWMFGIKDGFDIVIANPPWVFSRLGEFTKEEKEYYANNYIGASGKINLYSLFVFRGVTLSRQKACVSMIIPNTFIRASVYETLRRYLLRNTRFFNITDTGANVFESVTASTIVFFLENKPSSDQIEIFKFSDHRMPMKVNKINALDILASASAVFGIFADEQSDVIKKSVWLKSKPLSFYVKHLISGIQTWKGNKSEFISNEALTTQYKPLLEGKDIGRYYVKFNHKYILYSKKVLNVMQDETIFLLPKKIVIQRISGGDSPIKAGIDCGRYYCFNSINTLVCQDDRDNLFLLALLNSRLINWYYTNFFRTHFITS